MRRQSPGLVDTEGSWLTFFDSRLRYYQGFIEKWVSPGESENRIIVNYEWAMREPAEALKKAILFFFPNRILDDDRVRAIAERFSVRRDITEFRYYDDSLLERVNLLSSVSASEEIPIIKEP